MTDLKYVIRGQLQWFNHIDRIEEDQHRKESMESKHEGQRLRRQVTCINNVRRRMDNGEQEV